MAIVAVWAAVAFAQAPRRVENPHGALKAECEACHTATSWTTMRSPLPFDHATTGFALEGRHRDASCRACHASLEFAQAPASCADCHADVHRGRNGNACQDCHTPQRWSAAPRVAEDHARAGFPLRGGHALADCARCHDGEGEARHTAVSSACIACHADDYAATATPAHAAAGYSTRCESCHDAQRTGWSGASFNHAAAGFPLTGGHAVAACEQCHAGGVFTHTPTDCVACHQADYDATTAPAHRSAGYSTQCQTCHGTAAWTGASFNHAATGFALTGAHAATACEQCHAGGVFAGTPRDCNACHAAQYAATTNPAHAAAGFGTDCASCHTSAAWQPATFDHDAKYFRIDSGHHRGTWASCQTCHQNSASYADFTCLVCHEHDKARMDSEHRGRSGYSYQSSACYSCHRNA